MCLSSPEVTLVVPLHRAWPGCPKAHDTAPLLLLRVNPTHRIQLSVSTEMKGCLMQLVSAITRKRMASKALERLESSTEVISEIRQSMQLMQEHSSHCDTVLEAEQEKNAELELAMGKVKQENDRLLDKVESLEALSLIHI